MSRATTMTTKRQELIDGLEKVGGSVEAEDGEFLSSEQIADALGMKIGTPTAFTGFLRNAESSHLIRRTVKGRRTKAIYLVHGKTGAKKPAKTKGKNKSKATPVTRYKRRSVMPLPSIGTQVEVFMLASDSTGQMMLGLRDEHGATWNTNVMAFAAAPEVA